MKQDRTSTNALAESVTSVVDSSFTLSQRNVALIAASFAVLFLLRLGPFWSGNLWFDEVLTIDDYMLQPTLWGVVSQYPVANNHVLYSALLWIWSRVVDPYLYEQVLRLPSVIFTTTIIVLAMTHWRKWLGDRAAIICAATLVGSIVVASFAYQMRGYALSMLLGALLTSGSMELLRCHSRRGRLIAVISAALLPLVMPTNVLLIAAHLAFLALARPAEHSWPRWTRGTLLPIALAGAMGCVYYLLILNQFLNVVKNAEGWPSGLAVAGNWGLALVAHLGVLGALFLWQQRLLVLRGSDDANGVRNDLRLAWKALLPMLVVVVGFLLISRPAPFPRTFLTILPTITFAVAYGCRRSALLKRIPPIAVILLIGFWSMGWQIVTQQRTNVALVRGEHPQDLLMQYYRGRTDISELAAAMQVQRLDQGIALLTDFHDFSTTRYYWRVYQMPAELVLAKFHNFDQVWNSPMRPDVRLVVQATNEAHARVILDDAEQSFSALQPILTNDLMTLYLVETGDRSVTH